jgi:hypothetical protein
MRQARFDELLPSAVLALIYRTRLPFTQLQVTVLAGMVSSTPLLYFAQELRQATEESTTLGRVLGADRD